MRTSYKELNEGLRPRRAPSPGPFDWNKVKAIYRKLGFGDALILLYISVFIRQYAWIVADNALAWTLTALFSTLLWHCYLWVKETEEPTPAIFWLIVAFPLFVVYAMRVVFPDLSFDVLNYRLLQSERGLRGFLFLPGDFFPAIFPLDPAPDMLTGICRYILGYRLGTIINYLALVWAGTILCRILRPYIAIVWLRCLGVLLILVSEHMLFEINNYMIDLLALPLLLEATYLILYSGRTTRRNLILISIFLGASVALKLTNIAVVIPITLIYAHNIISSAPRLKLKSIAAFTIAGIAFIIPLLPHTIYIYQQTKSPVFPLYNAIFRSPFWLESNLSDGRWGPKGAWETIIWPILIIFKPERLSEPALYSGRISLGLIAATCCFLFVRSDRRIRALSFITVLGSMLWSVTTGYIRYGLYLELLSGVVILCLATYFLAAVRPPARFKRLIMPFLPVSALIVQVAIACNYIYRFEWSTRQTIFDDFSGYVTELPHLFRDHSLIKFFPPERRDLINKVDAWIISDVKTSGVEVLLRRSVPMLALHNPEYFETRESRDKFRDSLRTVDGKRIYSLCFFEDFVSCQEIITKRGLGIGAVTPLRIPFYSQATQLNMVLLEVRPSVSKQESLEAGVGSAPLPDTAFKAEISLPNPPLIFHAGRKEIIYVKVKNIGDRVWPARGQTDGKYSVTIGNSWFDNKTGKILNGQDGRSNLLYDLAPEDEVELPLTVTAPDSPGEYVLEIDAIQEQVAWFHERNSHDLRLSVRVEQ